MIAVRLIAWILGWIHELEVVFDELLIQELDRLEAREAKA